MTYGRLDELDHQAISTGSLGHGRALNFNDKSRVLQFASYSIGSIGELILEGPILARGYLNDKEKTAAAFIHDPEWLEGRQARFYKTGDLVRYDSNAKAVSQCIRAMIANPTGNLGDLNLMSQSGLTQLIKWNARALTPIKKRLHDLVKGKAKDHPDAPLSADGMAI